MNNKPRIVIIRANSIRSDTRTLKMYRSLNMFSECIPILWNRDSIRETEPKAIRWYFNIPLGSKKFLLYFPLWTIICVWQLYKLKPDAIHGCDLEGAIPAYIYSVFRKTPFIFDIHDVTEGKYKLNPKSLLRRLFLWADRRMIIKANAVFMPDPERMDQLELKKDVRDKISNKCFVVYNSDIITTGTKNITFSDKKQLVASYVGNLTRNIRGVEFILDAIPKFPNIFFHIAGMGADYQYFADKFGKLKTLNFKFWGRVSHDKAMEINTDSDFMISLLNPNFHNYKFASSTKLFEAFRLFKPIIVSDNTATSNIVNSTEWGSAIKYHKGELEKVLFEISSGKITYHLDSNKTAKYSWQEMEKIIHKVYSKLLNLPNQ
jgi:glycosyltransferase involved in cell wall biosynthesis